MSQCDMGGLSAVQRGGRPRANGSRRSIGWPTVGPTQTLRKVSSCWPEPSTETASSKRRCPRGSTCIGFCCRRATCLRRDGGVDGRHVPDDGHRPDGAQFADGFDAPSGCWRATTTHRRTPSSPWSAATNASCAATWSLPDENAASAIEIGTRLGVTPAVVIGRTCTARVTIFDGRVDEGLDLLDEIAIDLMSGVADPLTTGMMYCELICAAQGMALHDRASEWTDIMDRWRHGAAIGGISGRCRVHRAEMLRVSGPCDLAEAEALGACEELRPWMRREFGWPLVELGNIRLAQRRPGRRRRGVPGSPSTRLVSASRSGSAPAGAG